MSLHGYLTDAARSWPDRMAVREAASGVSVTYAELDALSDRVRDRLVAEGVRPGDRVGFWLGKSVDSVATIFGALKAGAAYVPVDPTAPAARNGFILADCGVRAIVVEARFEAALRAELADHGADPALIVIDGTGGGAPLAAALDAASAPQAATVTPADDALAYILYTSGSTGRPKGVQLGHRNAVAFVEWCRETYRPVPEDRFSSHAPLHFDLSILDLYTPLSSGASVTLFDEQVTKNPAELARLIAETGITVWYSAPSILSLLAQHGKLGERDYSALRAVLFAGEVFPVVHLRALTKLWPHPRYHNLYGPTETNVCTAYEVTLPIAPDRTQPMPIGPVCPHLEGVVVDEAGREVARGEPGELLIRGGNVTRGYWNLPEQTAKAFLQVGDGPAYYRTGDIVREEADGNLIYVGRRDRMIKKRGYRVELGEIETCLYRHPEIAEAAVVALPDEALGMKVIAHIATKDGEKLSLIALKTFCSKHIPVYMIPDVFRFHQALPKTSTDKVDYRGLQEMSRG
jgi:amino acid adenylation domain-containing protein